MRHSTSFVNVGPCKPIRGGHQKVCGAGHVEIQCNFQFLNSSVWTITHFTFHLLSDWRVNDSSE